MIDRFSTDPTTELAKSAGAQVVVADLDRSAARNVGAALSRCDKLLFVDSDMELTEKVLESTVKSLDSYAAVCLLEVSPSASGYWSRVRALERRSYFGIAQLQAARGFRREVFEKMGGFDSRLTGLEDMDLQARLVESGIEIGWVDSPIIHHDEQLGFGDYFTKRRMYGRADAVFAQRHPAFWRDMRSTTLRTRQILTALRRGGTEGGLIQLPGVAIRWFTEAVVRTETRE